MRDLLKYGALAAAAYIVYQQLYGQPAASQTPGTPATQPAGTSSTPTTAAASTTRQLLMAAAGSPAVLNFHEWNYFYARARGVQPQGPEAYGMGDGSRLITVDEYLAAIAGGGLSGIVRRWR